MIVKNYYSLVATVKKTDPACVYYIGTIWHRRFSTENLYESRENIFGFVLIFSSFLQYAAANKPCSYNQSMCPILTSASGSDKFVAEPRTFPCANGHMTFKSAKMVVYMQPGIMKKINIFTWA